MLVLRRVMQRGEVQNLAAIKRALEARTDWARAFVS